MSAPTPVFQESLSVLPPSPQKMKIWADLGSLSWSRVSPLNEDLDRSWQFELSGVPLPQVSGSSDVETNFCILRGYQLVSLFVDSQELKLCVNCAFKSKMQDLRKHIGFLLGPFFKYGEGTWLFISMRYALVIRIT